MIRDRIKRRVIARKKKHILPEANAPPIMDIMDPRYTIVNSMRPDYRVGDKVFLPGYIRNNTSIENENKCCVIC